MKKITFFLSAMMGIAFTSAAQWGGTGGPQTFTPSHVGISMPAVPADAKLRINSLVSNVIGGVDNVPVFSIHRQAGPWVFNPFSPSVTPNISEIWIQSVGGYVTTTDVLKDVIDGRGYYGILKNMPLQPLHVGGNALVEGNIAATNNVNIGTATYPNNARLSINAVYPLGASIPEVLISRTALFGGSANFLEIRRSNILGTGLLDVINVDGHLGILTSGPTAPLDVNGKGRIRGNLEVNGGVIEMPQTVDNWRQFNGRAVKGGLTISANSNSGNGSAIELNGTASGSMAGQIHYIANGTGGNGHVFYNYSGGTWTHQVAITNDGRMVIGYNLITSAATPAGYKLYVDDGILTKKLKVAGPGNWSDFVFAADYKLMPLNDVESYINANKHLPSIPSADEVGTEGIDVATMDAKLLQKVEELTLYVIEQQKQINEQNKKIEMLTKQINK